MNLLKLRFDVLAASCTTPSTLDSDIRALLERAERLRPGRQARALEASMTRSDAIRGRVRAAWGSRSLKEIDNATVRACIESMHLNGWRADHRTVRSELEIMKYEQSDFGMSDTSSGGWSNTTVKSV